MVTEAKLEYNFLLRGEGAKDGGHCMKIYLQVVNFKGGVGR